MARWGVIARRGPDRKLFFPHPSLIVEGFLGLRWDIDRLESWGFNLGLSAALADFVHVGEEVLA